MKKTALLLTFSAWFAPHSPALAEDLLFAKATPAVQEEAGADDTRPSQSATLSKDFWVRVYGGYDFSVLGDVINGQKGYAAWAKSLGFQGNYAVDHSGIAAGGECGLNLDKDNSFSVSVDRVWTSPETASSSNGVLTQTQTITPDLIGVSLNFYHTLIRGAGCSTFAGFGGGYYHANVDYSSLGPYNDLATLGGDILGGTFTLGEKVKLGDSFSLDLIARGRLAYFSEVTTQTVTGSYLYVPAPYTLCIQPPGYQVILLSSTASVQEGTNRAAGVDFSGFQGTLGLTYGF
jgi:hypothetical protein